MGLTRLWRSFSEAVKYPDQREALRQWALALEKRASKCDKPKDAVDLFTEGILTLEECLKSKHEDRVKSDISNWLTVFKEAKSKALIITASPSPSR